MAYVNLISIWILSLAWSDSLSLKMARFDRVAFVFRCGVMSHWEFADYTSKAEALFFTTAPNPWPTRRCKQILQNVLVCSQLTRVIDGQTDGRNCNLNSAAFT